MPIQRLSDDVIAQIAAGEVVERPASVVKELLENALDADATHITVEIGGGGQRLIRVSDDGGGIPADEVDLAILRHATSKLTALDDLYRIRTLGFRGEALASVMAVSHGTLSTRARHEEIGTRVRVEGGALVQRKPVGAPAGTVVTIENLFFNTPARLKFMKSEATEKRQIAGIVTRYAMAYPQVRFVLDQDGREVFRSTGSGQLGDVVVRALGLETFREMIEIDEEEVIRGSGMPIRVRGFVSTPDLHRKDRTRITLFVNGRAVQDTGLTYAVTQAYHTLLAKGRYPVAVLMVEVPPDFVDVNVHPTKAEVRFQDANVVFVAVQRAVRQAILGLVQHPQYRERDPDGPFAGAAARAGWQMPYDEDDPQRRLDLPGGDAGYLPPKDDFEAFGDEGRERSILDEEPRKRARTLPPLRVVGQVGAAYIVAEGPAGLYLIDQHAAHQRMVFEQVSAMLAEQGRLEPHAVHAQTFDVTGQEARVLGDHLAALAQVGVTIEAFGPTTFVIRAVPEVLLGERPQEVALGLLAALSAEDDVALEVRLLRRVARLAAVKVGHVMAQEEMVALVRELEFTPNPLRDLDEGPTLLHMTAQQLAREFGR